MRWQSEHGRRSSKMNKSLKKYLEEYQNGEGISRVRRWEVKAEENIEKWGVQTHEELLLAMVEELGELSQAYLEHNYEDGDRDRIKEELDDLAALMFQLDFKLYLKEVEG